MTFEEKSRSGAIHDRTDLKHIPFVNERGHEEVNILLLV
jgi:hypothetical protein